MKAEIAELKYKLAHLGEGDTLVGNDVIMDYRSGYPVPQSVVGYDFGKEWSLRTGYRQKIKKLQNESNKIEKYIESIPDSLTRRIFRMYFLEGRTQREIARCIHMDRSTVSRKLNALAR